MSKELIEWREKNLNKISKSFCAAKWYNASIHLGHGFTGSCHLPLPHPIDLEEIKTNPSAIHNTKHKKQMRKMMLKGVRPAECSYCWKIEDIGRNNVSDRVYKSIIYDEEDISKLQETDYRDDILLKTLEISFDRTCNFACSYCNAGYSTTWGKEIQKFGPYQKMKTDGAGAYRSDGSWSEVFGKHNERNPFVQAFFEWWPELSETLEEIRVTGGEPSLSHNFWDFIEVLKLNPAPNLRLAVNSNLGMTEQTLEKMVDMSHNMKIKEMDIYTSNESYGRHAEYIRDGLVYDQWRSNLVAILERAKLRSLTIMMTINSLCLFSITDFLDDMIELKKKYGANKPNVDLNILRWPAFMSPLALPDEVKVELHAKLTKWFNEKMTPNLFSVGEFAQVQRLLDYIQVVEKGHTTTEDNKSVLHHDFKSFYVQYDSRRGKNFKETFPELAEWYNGIKVDQSMPVVNLNDGRITHFETGTYPFPTEKII
jgi:organic radical activating enzyme